MTETARGRLGRRLGRILVMLPYAIRHPGVSVDELSRKFGVERKTLISDLELLFLCGLPGYGPGDLIDVSMDDDRVYVRMADYFSAPLRLTPAEAFGLYAQGMAIAELPEMGAADSLRRALAKLGRAIGLDEADDQGPTIEMKLRRGPAEHLDVLRRALEDGRRVRLEYFSASRGEMTQRDVDPWNVVVTGGHPYLIAWDHLSEDERMFRADRIKSVALLDDAAEVPADLDPRRYRSAFVERGGERTVSLEISPEAARWFSHYVPIKASRPLDDGWSAIEITSGSDAWVATVLLRLGDQARNVRPEAVLSRAQTMAETIAARHG